MKTKIVLSLLLLLTPIYAEVSTWTKAGEFNWPTSAVVVRLKGNHLACVWRNGHPWALLSDLASLTDTKGETGHEVDVAEFFERKGYEIRLSRNGEIEVRLKPILAHSRGSSSNEQFAVVGAPLMRFGSDTGGILELSIDMDGQERKIRLFAQVPSRGMSAVWLSPEEAWELTKAIDRAFDIREKLTVPIDFDLGVKHGVKISFQKKEVEYGLSLTMSWVTYVMPPKQFPLFQEKILDACQQLGWPKDGFK